MSEPDLISSPVEAVARRGSRRRQHLPQEFGVLAALVGLVAFLGLLTDTFLNSTTLLQLMRGASFFGIIALGMTYVLALGEIDLAVGSLFYLCSVIVSQVMIAGLDPWLAVFLVIVIGGVLAATHGLLALFVGIPLIIVGLGTLPLYRGLGLVFSGADDAIMSDTSSSFFAFVDAQVAGIIPMPVVVLVVLAVLLHVLLHQTRFGYRVLAIGSNQEAADLAGIPSWRTRLQVQFLLGALTGLAAVLSFGYFHSVDSGIGQGMELLVISAVIIGGTSLLGGSGTVFGTFVGILIIAVINSGIVHLGVPPILSGVVTGTVILTAVVLDRVVRPRLRGA